MNVETYIKAKKIVDEIESISKTLEEIDNFISNLSSMMSNKNTEITTSNIKLIVSSDIRTPVQLKLQMNSDEIGAVAERHKGDLQHRLDELNVELKKL